MCRRQVLAGIRGSECEEITDLSSLDVDDAQVLAVPHPHSPARTGGNHHVGWPVSELHDTHSTRCDNGYRRTSSSPSASWTSVSRPQMPPSTSTIRSQATRSAGS